MNTRQLQEAVNEYQTGAVEQPDINIKPQGQQTQTKSPYDIYMERLLNIDISQGVQNDYTQEALDSGFGISRFDSSFVPGMDIEDSRAKAQPAIAKIGAGALKLGGRALTTAANTIAGTVAGIVTGPLDLIFDFDDDGKRGIREAFDAATNNWVSDRLIRLDRTLDDIVPVYRTAEEMTDEYQEHYIRNMFKPASISDFLSNFGFTLGAVGAGAFTSRLLGKAMSKKFANDLMKGVAVGAEGDAEAVSEIKRIQELIKSGEVVGVDSEKLMSNVTSIAERINNAEARLQLYGATLGAIGEGSAEGLMAKNEFLEDYNRKLQTDFAQRFDTLEDEMVAEGDSRFVQMTSIIGNNGEIIQIPGLTPVGQQELNRRRQELLTNLQQEQQQAELEGERLARITQMLNIPVLTLTNTMTFGRILSGGWKTSRRNVGKVWGRKPKIGETITAKYKSGPNTFGRTVLGTLKTMATEGSEEMIQGFISSGQKARAEERMSSFVDAGYDSDAVQEFSKDFLNAAWQGGIDYLAEDKNWQEGWLGAITGLLGIPGKRWGGGVIGAYQEAKEKAKASKDAADGLNKLVNSTDFRNRWEGFIRHQKYNADMDTAVAADDEYAWHTADDNQLISDVIAFADAGRINDLYKIINSFGSMTEQQANDLKSVLSSPTENGEADPWLRNATPADIVERVKSQADKIKTTVDLYRDTYDAVSSLAPHDASPSYLKELIATSMQVKQFEKRFLGLLDDVLKPLDNTFMAIGAKDKDGNLLSLEDTKRQAEEIKRAYEANIAGSILPSNLPASLRKIQEDVLDEIEAAVTDEALKKKVQDLRKISAARKAFYEKFAKLRTEAGQKQHEEEKVTPDKVEQAAEEAAARIETSGLTDLNSVKKSYFDILDEKGRDSHLEVLRQSQDKNPAIKKFIAIKDRYDEFYKFFKEHLPEENAFYASDLIFDIERLAQSVEDVENLPDSVFESADEFIAAHSNGVFGSSASVEEYEAAKEAVREVMKKFLEVDSSTGSRRVLAENAEVKQEPVPATNPTGRDASHGGSIVEQPKITDEKKKKRERKKTEKKEQKPEDVQPAEEKGQLPESTGNSITIGDKESQAAFVSTHPDWTATENEDGSITYTRPSGSVETNVTVVNQGKNKVAEEAVDTFVEEDNEVIAGETRQTDGKRTFYQMTVPEVETEEAIKAREALREHDREKYESADLSGFVDLDPKNHKKRKNPGYLDTWMALNNAGAFEYVANSLRVGDKLKFIIDPNFPTYKGGPQILVATEVDGKNQILTTLSMQEKDYFGLKELRKDILDAYAEFILNPENTGKVFEFSKQTTVWGKREGVVEYDFSGKEYKFNGFVGHENVPIVFVDPDGVARFVYGDKEKLSMPESFLDSSLNNGSTPGYPDRRGHLYALVDSGIGRAIPIRLNVEHFNEKALDSKSESYDVFTGVRNIISDIANKMSTLTSDNVQERKGEIRGLVGKLGELIDLTGLDFVVNDFGEDKRGAYIGVALAINSVKVDEAGHTVRDEEKESRMFTPQQATEDALLSYIAGLDRSMNVKFNREEKTVSNISSLVDSGAITTNAKKLRVRQANFLYDSYIPSKEKGKLGEFGHIEPAESQRPVNPEPIVQEVEESPFIEEEDDDTIGDMPDFNADAEDDDLVVDIDYADEPVETVDSRSKDDTVKQEIENSSTADESDMKKYANVKFDKLPEKIKKHLSEKRGWTQDAWDDENTPGSLKEKVLNCLVID